MRKKVRIIGKNKIKSRPKKPSYIEKLFNEQYNSAVIEFEPFLPYEFIQSEYTPKQIVGLHSEYKYNPNRKFRLDFAIPFLKIGIELEGGIWHKGGHSSGHGITRDCIKYNDLQRLGWKVFRFTSEQVKSKYAINWLINYFISQYDYYGLFIQYDLEQTYVFDTGQFKSFELDIQEGLLPKVLLKTDDKKQP